MRALKRFMTAAAITGLALVSALGVAGTASAAIPTPANDVGTTSALASNPNGPWTDNGPAKPIITIAANQVVIDMSYARRPNGVGTVLDGTSIVVTFPDADTYIGTFLSPTVLRWSNGAQWQKVYTGPTVIGLNTTWTDGSTRHPIAQANGYLTVNMRALNRPNGAGYIVNASTIRVTYPGFGTYTGTLKTPGFINWSDGSRWHEFIDQSPGNPQCLLPDPTLPHTTFC